MAFTITDPRAGMQPIATTSTTQNHPEGTIVRGEDSTLGGGEFIYLKGVASTVIGSLVTYDAVSHSTTLTPNTANLSQPIAVAMSANVGSQWGWYQISGPAVIKKTAVKFSPNVALYQSGTAGRVQSLAASGKQIVNARTLNAATVASATSTITALLNRSFMQGAVA